MREHRTTKMHKCRCVKYLCILSGCHAGARKWRISYFAIQKILSQQSLLGQDEKTSCGATRLGAHAPSLRIPSYAGLLSRSAPLRLAYSAFAFPLALGCPFSATAPAALAPPAALWMEPRLQVLTHPQRFDSIDCLYSITFSAECQAQFLSHRKNFFSAHCPSMVDTSGILSSNTSSTIRTVSSEVKIVTPF